jgi:lipid-A-disaccharide synthase
MSLAVERAPEARGEPAGFSPKWAVATEYARAAGSLVAAPAHVASYLARRKGLVRALELDLAETRAVEDVPSPTALPRRPLRFFVASAEVSGERHALGLVAALRAELESLGAPEPEFLALGGARTRALGVETVGDPLERAAMGIAPLRSLSFYGRLLVEAGEALTRFRPDLVVPVDSPALFVPLARIARAAGFRPVHFVAPQYWAWAPWRACAYRQAFELALTILPFEPAWWARHGMRTAHVGHPALDGLPPAPPRDDPRRTALVLLPGSRRHVIARNLPWMLALARELHVRHPRLPILLSHGREELRAELEAGLRDAGASEWVELALGDVHEALARSRAALSVSGTVLIDLLHQRLPAAVVYRLGRVASWAAPRALTVPWFSSVNLLARAAVYWEATFHGSGPRSACLAHLERALFDEGFRSTCGEVLEGAAGRLGPPGAGARAARHLLRLLATGQGPK